MQITGNYQIFSNKVPYTNHRYQNYHNNSQYLIQNNINCPIYNTSSDQYLKNKATQIAFTAIPKESELKTAVENILNRSIVFGPKEYKKLSNEELSIMREYRKYFENTDLKNIPNMLYISKLFSEGIHKQYPNGFTLVSIGRSPAFLAKYLEFQGADVKYCPVSNLSSIRLRVTPDFIQAYKKYLGSIGLTADFVETTEKPIIFTDFVFDGDTLRNFKSLLALPEFDMNNDKKMHFRSIAAFTESGLLQQKGSYYLLDGMYRKYRKVFDEPPTAKSMYSSVPYIDAQSYKVGTSYEGELLKYHQNGNQFEENFDTKMMNFILADSQVS